MAKYNDLTTGQSEACINRMGGWDNFLRFIGGEGKIFFETILTFTRTVCIAAQSAATTSKEYFKEAGVVLTGTNFETQFYGLEVSAVAENELAVRKLTKNSLDAPIMAELGDKAETSVLQFRAFLAANHDSKEWFIFYLRGKDRRLGAVRAYWRIGSGGWRVRAYSVDNPNEWSAGGQVVSRN